MTTDYALSPEQILGRAGSFSGEPESESSVIKALANVVFNRVKVVYPLAVLRSAVIYDLEFVYEIADPKTEFMSRRTTLFERWIKKMPKQVDEPVSNDITLIGVGDGIEYDNEFALFVRVNDSRLIQICEEAAKMVSGKETKVLCEF